MPARPVKRHRGRTLRHRQARRENRPPGNAPEAQLGNPADEPICSRLATACRPDGEAGASAKAGSWRRAIRLPVAKPWIHIRATENSMGRISDDDPLARGERAEIWLLSPSVAGGKAGDRARASRRVGREVTRRSRQRDWRSRRWTGIVIAPKISRARSRLCPHGGRVDGLEDPRERLVGASKWRTL